MRHLAYLALLSVILALSACEFYKLEELNRVEPDGTPFQKALAANYRGLSMEEQRAYDWWTAVDYAGKSLTAAYGEGVAPEELKDWNIPDDVLPRMESAREKLILMLASDAKLVQPQRAADAQAFFDCWLEQQEEGWQVDDIARCRDGFYEAMDDLSQPALPAAKPAPAPSEPAASKPAAPKPAAAAEPKIPKDVETASYIVFFDAGAATLTEMGEKIVDSAAESLTSHASYQVVVNAHTDTLGGATRPDLPRERAQTIKSRLVLQGIPESAIDILARGETKSPSDALFNPKPVERKIEIFISE